MPDRGQDQPSDPVERVASSSHVVSRPLAIALAGILLLVAAAVIWIVLAQAQDTIGGRGIILPESGLAEVRAPRAGEVAELLVAPGSIVAKGQRVARIDLRANGWDYATSPVAGQIADVPTGEGVTVGTDDALMFVVPKASKLVLIAYLPAGEAKSVTPGMDALISPQYVASAQYGDMEGVVVGVGLAPATSGRLLGLLGENPSLVKYFMDAGPVLEIRIRPKPDSTSPSGFKWTFGNGPPGRITAGTLADVSVVLDTQPVLDQVTK